MYFTIANSITLTIIAKDEKFDTENKQPSKITVALNL